MRYNVVIRSQNCRSFAKNGNRETTLEVARATARKALRTYPTGAVAEVTEVKNNGQHGEVVERISL